MNKIKFKIHTLGCKINQYDSNNLAFELKRFNFEECINNADLIIINTCAVTMNAIRKDKKMINKAKIKNSNAKIIILGCWPQVYTVDKNEYDADLVCGVNDAQANLQKIIKLFSQYNKKTNKNNFSPSDRKRYFIKIQDGCEQFCSYCIIPYTRGKLKSRYANDIVNEIKQAIKSGYNEIVLSGVHLGLYGMDIVKDNKYNLSNLIKEIIKVKGLGRIRLSSIEITEVTDELIDLMTNNDKVCKHLHISLQSGCDKILKLMNRPYSTEFYRNKVEKIRKKIPKIALTTDIIVGFPGETDDDFKNTLEFANEINFSKIHVFPFSEHKKTKAYFMKNKISKKEKSKRADILRKLSINLENKYKKSFVNNSMNVVVENIENNIIKGKTEYYFDIFFKKSQITSEVIKGKDDLIRKIVTVKY